MRTKFAIIIVPLALLCVSASGLAEDIISRLGLKHTGAQSYLLANITGSFSSDYDIKESVFFYPRITTLANIVSGDKIGAAKDLCQYVKDYANSQEFQDEYSRKRAASKPTYEPERMDPEAIQNMRSSIDELEAQLTDLKKSPKENAQTIAMFEPMVESQKASLAEYEDPTPNKTKWEKNYPVDPAILVRKKLQDYLDLVATVDFDAKLTAPDKYKIKKFVNPVYETKSPEWKACYRAGKEVNATVTTFVKDWLKGEIISSNKVQIPKDPGSSPASSVNASSATSLGNPNAGTEAQDNRDAESGEAAEPAKEKTSLLGKLKKAKALIKE